MIPYASNTGTKRNLAALREANWRLMISARGDLVTRGFKYALDNGAWTAFQEGKPFDVPAFEKAVALIGKGADFIVAPDIVMGGLESLQASLPWLPRLEPLGVPVLVPVQNGMEDNDLRQLLSPQVGIFCRGGTRPGRSRRWDAGRAWRMHTGRSATSVA